MIRRNRSRACALVAATVVAAGVALAGGAPTAGADESLVESATWQPFPADTVGHGFVAVDDGARVGYAFSGTLGGTWRRVQALDLDTGRARSAVTEIRPMASRTPVLVDTRRHVLIYAETHNGDFGSAGGSFLVGAALRGKEVKEVFRVASPVGNLRIAGLAFDETGDDILVVGTAEGSGQNVVQGSSVVQVQRVSVDALVRNTLTARWPEAYALPPGACPTLLQTNQPAGVLAYGDRVYVACRGVSATGTAAFVPQAAATSNAIVQVSGAGRTRAATPSVRLYRTPGNFAIAGESFTAPRTRRFLLVESSGYIGLRVFDTDHGRYVGRINAGKQTLYGAVADEKTSRVYFASYDETVGLGFGDAAALVPTQGERIPVPYAAYIGNGTPRRMSFDSAKRRLLLPIRRQTDDGRQVESVLVFNDKSDPYRAPAPIDHALGSIDAVDRAGVTDSSIATTARAYGADYQLIGGTANLLQNASGVDTRGVARPGSRHLRQAYVKSSSLTGDGAESKATTGEEDQTTDQDRNSATAPSPAPSSATAGSRFAPVAECADYGVGKTEAAAPRAKTTCDLRGELVTATTDFLADDAVLVTTPGVGHESPVLAPIQTGRSHTEVRQQRLPNRGPLVTTIKTVTDNVTIGDVASFGRVTQTVTLSVQGRTGTASVKRETAITNVVVQGRDVCGSQCHPAQVQQQVNAALNGRGFVEFPAAHLVAEKRGTYAELTQDFWYHAERVLDYDKPNDDYVVPVMSIHYWMDFTSKSRLVVDIAGVAATASYRVYPLGSDDFDDDGGDDGGDGGVVIPDVDDPRPVPTLAPSGPAPVPTNAPAPQAAGPEDGPVNTIVDRLSLSLRSLREAIPLLLIWALLAVPTYLAARRRLLLELPMLTRDEELTT